MNVSFGKEIYHDAMCGIDIGKDSVTFNAKTEKELMDIVLLVLSQGCDVLIENNNRKEEGSLDV